MTKISVIAEPKLRGLSFNLPDVGVTEIPEDGILELPENVATALVNSGIGYRYNKPEESKPADDNTDSSDANDNNDPSVDLKALSLDDLIALAKEAGLPEEEWVKLSQNTKKAQQLMVGYLTKKLKA